MRKVWQVNVIGAGSQFGRQTEPEMQLSHINQCCLCLFYVTPSLILIVLSRCTNGPLGLFVPDVRLFALFFVKFHNSSELFFTFHFGPVRLHTIGEYVSQVSFNWLLPCWVFRTGQRTSVLFFGFVFGRLVTHRYTPVCQ